MECTSMCVCDIGLPGATMKSDSKNLTEIKQVYGVHIIHNVFKTPHSQTILLTLNLYYLLCINLSYTMC